MTEPKFTKGPWSVVYRKRFSLSGNVHIVSDGDRFPSAFVPAWDAPEAGEVDGTEEAAANARLIAAAPQMYEALKAANEALAQITAFEDDARHIMGNTNFEIVKQRRGDIRAALSAAVGEDA